MRLHINIDHVATVRQARRTDEPDPVRAAVLAELGGADGITVHLREDRRHIQDRDVRLLVATARTAINLELAAEDAMLDLAAELAPAAATLVPERREEVTTEGGLDLAGEASARRAGRGLERLRAAGIRTSLFVDPDEAPLRRAAELGTEAVELHTGAFAEAWKRAPGGRAGAAGERTALRLELERIRRAAALGRSLGLDVHAGHGLTYENVAAVAAIPEIEELNIGHSVVSRAVLIGMERAVREMKALVIAARGGLGDPRP
jgi:pyridoxine 5-phosphate synthase